jgi:hypothetical protein
MNVILSLSDGEMNRSCGNLIGKNGIVCGPDSPVGFITSGYEQ